MDIPSSDIASHTGDNQQPSLYLAKQVESSAHAKIPASSGGTANSVNVVFGVGGDVVVDNAVYSGNIQPSAGHICSQAMTAVDTPQALDLLLQMQAV